MIKTVEIVSLSSGTIGESFASHELKIGLERLKNMGLQVKFSGHALKGIEYIKAHPEDRKGRVLLLESSEEQPTPEMYEKMLIALKDYGLFDAVSGVLVGKPMDEKYAEEYKKLLVSIIDNPELPVLCNINIGHATPRCIFPFGVNAIVDADKQLISF